ncbi:uncharacterized protein LOC133778419 [Humulus lupulus]|uniref:uncharacterized protein LOC133778419 n=1 Tax=Humulus lupulus TaxID=3486 RepID=UPI002B415C40|nr:uncharacterized protein LOC133778419 [Humulus lupulus]
MLLGEQFSELGTFIVPNGNRTWQVRIEKNGNGKKKKDVWFKDGVNDFFKFQNHNKNHNDDGDENDDNDAGVDDENDDVEILNVNPSPHGTFKRKSFKSPQKKGRPRKQQKSTNVAPMAAAGPSQVSTKKKKQRESFNKAQPMKKVFNSLLLEHYNHNDDGDENYDYDAGVDDENDEDENDDVDILNVNPSPHGTFKRKSFKSPQKRGRPRKQHKSTSVAPMAAVGPSQVSTKKKKQGESFNKAQPNEEGVQLIASRTICVEIDYPFDYVPRFQNHNKNHNDDGDENDDNDAGVDDENDEDEDDDVDILNVNPSPHGTFKRKSFKSPQKRGRPRKQHKSTSVAPMAAAGPSQVSTKKKKQRKSFNMAQPNDEGVQLIISKSGNSSR